MSEILKFKEAAVRVGVLMGGLSVEREVSFNSGRTVCDHIDTSRFEAVPIFQTSKGELYILPLKFLHRGKISDFEHRLSKEATHIVWDDLRSLVDFIYISVHGLFGEDGTLQGALEVLGIPYLGSKVFGSACGINKIFQKKVLRSNGIKVPREVVITPKNLKEYSEDQIVALMEAQKISFPCIIKPSLEGSSAGVSVVASKKDLIPALKNACYKSVTFQQPALIEEKIDGMEFTCIAVNKNGWLPFPITEIVLEKGSSFYDYEQKYMPGRSSKITPARCSAELAKKIQETCVRVSDLLGFSTFFRTDGFLTKDGEVFIIDPNTLSGMGPASFLFHQAAEANMGHSQLINYLIECELSNKNFPIKKFSMEQHKIMDAKDTKKKVLVLLGGDSNEREISLESGRNVCYKLSPSKYDVTPVFVDDHMRLFTLNERLLIQNSTREIARQVEPSSEIKWADLPRLADFVFIGLHGGKGENGSVQGMLDMLGIPYNGPGVLASALCMDKFRTNSFLRKEGFDVPDSILISVKEWDEKKDYDLKYPVIIKPHDDGCSMFVDKARNKKELEQKVDDYFKNSGKPFIMVEECIVGMELTCGVFGNDDVTVLPPSYSVATGGILSIEEKFLPGAGENQTPAPISENATRFVQRVLKDVFLAIGCRGYSRIDCFYQDEKISPTGHERLVILEINTLPGLTPATCLFHQAAEVGIKPMELVDKVVQLGFEARASLFFTESEGAATKGAVSKSKGS